MVKNEFTLSGFTGQEVEKIALALANLPYREVVGIIMKIDRQMIEQMQELSENALTDSSEKK